MDRTKDQLAQKTDQVMEQARQQTGQAIDQVRGNAFQMMDQQKHRAADSLGSVAQALHQTGENLSSGQQDALGQYAHRAAETVDQFAQQLRDKNVDQLLSEAESFARREPEVFLGGAVLLGLLAARFFKASSRRSQMRDYDQYGYQYRRSYQEGSYGRPSAGPGGYDRGTWNDEGINYRSAGTGGYRTSISGGTGSETFGSTTGSSDISAGRERASRDWMERRSGMTGESEDASWPAGEDEATDIGAGSSEA
ncbi:MAG: hypothetical protein ACM30E_02800 [Nitrososphaerales archaeon]